MKFPELILPWQQNSWDLFSSYIKQHRIPQALLINGQAGLGKLQLARQMAQSLLCEQSLENEIYCNICHSCTLFIAETHPDFQLLEPEKEAKYITVAQIRSLISKLQLKSQYNSYRVIIINSAELMNVSAANCFLKCLEEPGDKTLMLLVTDKPAALPATIVSRCQKIKIPIPDRQLAINWLRQQKASEDVPALLSLAQGAPLLAVKYGSEQILSLRDSCFQEWIQIAYQRAEPVDVAEEWHKFPRQNIVSWLMSWIMDTIKLHNQTDILNLYNPDLQESLQELAQKLDLIEVFEFYELLLQSRKNTDSNLNSQLFIEELLINWSQLNRKKQHYG